MAPERPLALRAGLIHTLDPARPQVECLGMRGGRVAAVGTADEVGSVIGEAEWLDLRPAVVTPGLTDSHIHILEWCLGRERPDISDARTMDQVRRAVQQAVESSPRDAWIEIGGWDPSLWRPADRGALDRAANGRAVGLIAHDLHSGWLSSEALRRLGITRDRPDPPGGEVDRDESGRPTGILREEALGWWYEGRPTAGPEDRVRALRQGQTFLHELGITGIHSVEAADSFRTVQTLDRAGELRLRVLQHVPLRSLDELVRCGVTSGFGGPWVRIGGLKIFSDGALGSRTAWMLEPYDDTDGTGIARLSAQELSEIVETASRAGVAATVHAIGDAAVRMTLDVLESANSKGLALPHRIEHLQCVSAADMDRAGRAGIVGSMQPCHLLTDIPIAERAWGHQRCRGAFAFRSLLGAGTVLAFGSDAPVEDPDPRHGLYAALARTDRSGQPADGWYPEERLSGREVLAAYTLGPAHAAGLSDQLGRLAPGFLADLVAWDADVTALDAAAVRSVRVVATIVGGERVYGP